MDLVQIAETALTLFEQQYDIVSIGGTECTATGIKMGAQRRHRLLRNTDNDL